MKGVKKKKQGPIYKYENFKGLFTNPTNLGGHIQKAPFSYNFCRKRISLEKRGGKKSTTEPKKYKKKKPPSYKESKLPPYPTKFNPDHLSHLLDFNTPKNQVIPTFPHDPSNIENPGFSLRVDWKVHHVTIAHKRSSTNPLAS